MIEKALAILTLLRASAKTLAIIALIAVASGIYLSSRADRRKAQADSEAKDKAFASALAEAGQNAIKSERVGKIVGSPEMEKRTAQLIKAGGRAVALTNETIAIKDESKAVALGPTAAAGECQKTWGDQYQRFFLDIPSGLFERSQLFHLEQKFVRSPSGEYSVAETLLREFNPITKVEIPNTGVKISGTYSVVEEKAQGPGPFHLYGVAAVDQRLAFGGGVQIEPKRHLTVSLLGLYSKKDKDGEIALHVGFRPGAWAFAFGPAVGYSTRLKLTFGIAATIRLWGDTGARRSTASRAASP